MSWTTVTATGGAIIAALTLLSATYLLYFLLGHGRGKLRVQLLIGVVASDIVIGLVALPAEALFVADKPIQTDTAACDVQAWVYTTTLFSQNLWTLAVATATFMLLKHPLAPLTTAMERWSWTTWPLVWGLSLLHSGLWWRTRGFANTGSLCYYGTLTPQRPLDRDLIQFIPRATVFLIIVCLYSSLYSFLRRPDTIQLSSQLAGSDPGAQSRLSFAAKLARAPGKLSCVGGTGAGSMPKLHDPSLPPWEQLSFCHIAQYDVQGSVGATEMALGGRTTPGVCSLASMSETEPETPTSLFWSHPASVRGGSGSVPSSPRRDRPMSYERKGSVALSMLSTLVGHTESVRGIDVEAGLGSPLPSPVRAAAQMETLRQVQRRPSVALSVMSALPVPEFEFKPPPPPVRSDSDEEGLSEDDSRIQKKPSAQTFTTRADVKGTSNASPATLSLNSLEVDLEAQVQPGRRRSSGPTLKEFFLANQVTTDPRNAPPTRHMSATAYFNRQASLLMLWFPLAYVLVFSVSLVRLIVDMVARETPPFLSLLSSWMVLSVGLIDAVMFGLAEAHVRRRVRQQMPDRLG